jgi:hypothetical protein
LGIAGVGAAAAKATDVGHGEFDVYHFQIFSVVVGGALLVVGLSDLATFSIPETLLGVLGLSQVIYVGGKLVMPPTFSELNTATKALRELERDFVATAARTPHPAAPNVLGPPADLNEAIQRAGREKYDAYMDSMKNVRIMFEAVTGHQVCDNKLEPAFAF